MGCVICIKNINAAIGAAALTVASSACLQNAVKPCKLTENCLKIEVNACFNKRCGNYRKLLIGHVIRNIFKVLTYFFNDRRTVLGYHICRKMVLYAAQHFIHLLSLCPCVYYYKAAHTFGGLHYHIFKRCFAKVYILTLFKIRKMGLVCNKLGKIVSKVSAEKPRIIGHCR